MPASKRRVHYVRTTEVARKRVTGGFLEVLLVDTEDVVLERNNYLPVIAELEVILNNKVLVLLDVVGVKTSLFDFAEVPGDDELSG